jgi:hypothetical protein
VLSPELPREIVTLEVVDGMFRLDSAVVLPEAESPSADVHEALTTTSVLATALRFAEANPTRTLLVAGHTDTSGTESHNQELSEARASVALACLEGTSVPDHRERFGELCHERHTIADYKQILSWAARQFGFSCDPGAIDNQEFSGIAPIKAFQRDYNANRAGLGVPDAAELEVDGSMGPLTWRAIFDCYEAALAQEVSTAASAGERQAALAALRQKLRFVDDAKKSQGFGMDHPIDQIGRANVRSQANRRVELLFFNQGQEPDLGEPAADSTIFEPGVYTRRPIDAATPGSILVLVTDTEGALVPGASLSATGTGLPMAALANAAGMASLPSVPPGSYVLVATKDDHWVDRVTVTVAPASRAIFDSRG